MAFITVPSASIAAGKPITTGLMTIYKNNDDSFNDGTGIADGVVSNRASYRRTIKEDCWEQGTYAAPPEWTVQTGGSTQSVVALNSIYHTKSLNAAGIMGWTLNRKCVLNSGRTARFRAVLATPGTSAGTTLGVALYLDATHYIVLGFYNSTFILQAYNGSVTTSPSIAAFSINTDYILDLVATSALVTGYVYNFTTGALIGSTTINTNIPAASLLIPLLGSFSGSDANGIMVAESQFTTDALR